MFFKGYLYYNFLYVYTDFVDIIIRSYDVFLLTFLFMMMNFEMDEFFFVKIGFSDFVDVLKISLLWHTLLLQRKWVCRKRQTLQNYRNIYATRDINNVFCEHNIEPMKRNECRVTNHVIYRLYATSKADEKMTRL